ncbi:MAG: CPBP family intramembrane glutamic endopeptidase [Candidatus Bathyarchaeia archaeon]
MEEQWMIFLGLYAFAIAYAIYFLFTYKVDPRFSLKYKKTPSFSHLLGLSILEKTIFILLLLFLSALPNRKLIYAFSLDKLDFSLNVIYLGILGGFAVFLAGMPVSWLVSILRRKFSFPKMKREEELMRLLQVSMPHSLTELFMTLLLTSVSAAILEEIIFRGYLLNHLLLVVHPALAVTVQAFLFFFPHLYQGIYNALLPLLSGFIFGLIFYSTDSLSTVIVAHFTADFIGLLLTVSSMRKRR